MEYLEDGVADVGWAPFRRRATACCDHGRGGGDGGWTSTAPSNRADLGRRTNVRRGCEDEGDDEQEADERTGSGRWSLMPPTWSRCRSRPATPWRWSSSSRLERSVAEQRPAAGAPAATRDDHCLADGRRDRRRPGAPSRPRWAGRDDDLEIVSRRGPRPYEASRSSAPGRAAWCPRRRTHERDPVRIRPPTPRGQDGERGRRSQIRSD